MKSGAKGKGHDHYIRMQKQRVSQSKADAWKSDLKRREKEREERDGTVGKTVYRVKRESVPLAPGSPVSPFRDRIHREAS